MKLLGEFTKGLIRENPVLVLLLGLCPTLAVTTGLRNAVGMGISATFVLVCSNIIIAMFKGFFPKKIRIPCFIVVIATFVTIVQMALKAYFPDLDEELGIFIPLIVVNCIILGRAEAFASRQGLVASTLDGVGMGVGFTLALCVIALFREVLGKWELFGTPITDGGFQPAAVMIMALGAKAWIERRFLGTAVRDAAEGAMAVELRVLKEEAEKKKRAQEKEKAKKEAERKAAAEKKSEEKPEAPPPEGEPGAAPGGEDGDGGDRGGEGGGGSSDGGAQEG